MGDILHMPTPYTARIEALEKRVDKYLDAFEARMQKYDEIIDDLRTIVIALKAKDDATTRANQKWINTILALIMVGATLMGGVIGALSTHFFGK